MIITLCGSARFEHEFKQWSEKLTMMGHTPIGLAVYPSDKGDRKDWYTPDQKETLDLIHLNKILAADAILVLNVGGYVGDSTRREIKWAEIHKKEVFYLESITPAHREYSLDVHMIPHMFEYARWLEAAVKLR